jgi:hypothetical protein
MSAMSVDTVFPGRSGLLMTLFLMIAGSIGTSGDGTLHVLISKNDFDLDVAR